MILLLISLNGLLVQQAHAVDEYDTLREKWKVMVTGGTSINTSDPDIAARITEITATAHELFIIALPSTIIVIGALVKKFLDVSAPIQYFTIAFILAAS